ncbi:MAG: hypothetical protein WCQ21_28780 [Verrucomicrobiota bacterium]
MNSSLPRRRGSRRVLSPEEYKRQRRDRRMERTSRLESQVRAWAEGHGCSLRVLNDGHHWLFQKPGFMAEWWPSSARLAVTRDYGRYIHAPQWTDVVAVLQEQLATPLPAQPAAQAETDHPTSLFL